MKRITHPTLHLLALLVLAACVPDPITPIRTVMPFDPSLAAYIMDIGDNTITGQAFLRQRGGGVVTCAGASVFLVPQTPHSQERFGIIYGTITEPALGVRIADDADPRYLEFVRETTCDAEGDFRFVDVPDGEYFVQTRVDWVVASVRQGGPVMAPVTVSGGAEVNILIVP